jgi:hypothetical protein
MKCAKKPPDLSTHVNAVNRDWFSRRQLTPNFGRIFGPRAWATLSSFGCNLPGPGVIVPKTRQPTKYKASNSREQRIASCHLMRVLL